MPLQFSVLNLHPSAGGNDLFLGVWARAGAAVMTSLDPRGKGMLTKGRCPPPTWRQPNFTAVSFWSYRYLRSQKVYSFVIVTPFASYSQKWKRGRKRRLKRPPPPVPHMCGPWQRKMDFYTRLAAAWSATLAMLTHYKGKLNGPCQICFSFGRLRRASTVSQCGEKWLDGFRKYPITGGLLLPVGFPLEQLSVSVSLGKPQKHPALMTLTFSKRLRAYLTHQSNFSYWFCALVYNFQVLLFYSGEIAEWRPVTGVVCAVLHVRALSALLGCLHRLLTSALSVRVKRFSVNEHVVEERAAADRARSSSSCSHQRWRTFLQVHITRGEMEQLEYDKFSNWWLKGADIAFVELVRSGTLQILNDWLAKEGDLGLGLNDHCYGYKIQLLRWLCPYLQAVPESLHVRSLFGILEVERPS